jgi:uncharacterized protein (DUF885 family)
MHRRAFVETLGAAAVTVALPVRAAQAAAGSNDAPFRAVLDRIFADRLAQSPESATSLGLDTGKNAKLKAQLSGRTKTDDARDLARSKRELAAVRAFDPATLGENARLDQDILVYQLERSITGRQRFTYGAAGGRYAPYRISQISGAYQDVPDFLDTQHRVKDAVDADAYLARLEAFARVLDQETARQREDAARGVFAPDYILDTTLKQFAALRDRKAQDTGLVAGFAAKLAAAKLPADRADAAARVVADKVFPALDRQRALITALRAKASHDAGAWRLPDGEAYYAAAAEAATTVKLTGDEIHRMGLEQVAEIEARIDTILKGQGMSQGSVGARLVALNQRPDQLFPNTDPGREALLAELTKQIQAMAKRLPEQFATLPQAPVEVRRVPPAIQAGSPGGYYQAATLDGSRPAEIRPRHADASRGGAGAPPAGHARVGIEGYSADPPARVLQRL